MATLDELQAQLEELIRRVNEITAPPDDYYTHRFSGEEIDNAVGRVKATPGSGAITAGDIGAAPSGFGLGAFPILLNSSNDLNKLENASGWYYWGSSVPQNAPTTDGATPIPFATLLSCGWTQLAFAASTKAILTRTVVSGSWGQWEWINPPMVLGVEYRTTERHLGSPVYTKSINLGEPINLKVITTGANNVFDCDVSAKYASTGITVKIPQLYVGFSQADLPSAYAGAFYLNTNNGVQIVLITGESFSADSMTAIIKYTRD